jgi:hypothetical protein
MQTVYLDLETTADLRVELAAATERASHTDDLRQLLAGLQQAEPAEGEG